MKTFWIAAAVTLAATGACGGSGSDTGTTTSTTSTTSGGGNGCLDFASAKTGVSFKSDVMPIFQASCNFSACHSSDSSNPMEQLALGKGKSSTMTDAEITEVRDAIVGAGALRSTFALVEPGKPTESWLLLKTAYSSFSTCETVSTACTGDGCGSRMPSVGGALTQDQIDTIAGWIADGAENN